MYNRVNSWYRQIKEALLYDIDIIEWTSPDFNHQN